MPPHLAGAPRPVHDDEQNHTRFRERKASGPRLVLSDRSPPSKKPAHEEPEEMHKVIEAMLHFCQHTMQNREWWAVPSVFDTRDNQSPGFVTILIQFVGPNGALPENY